MLNAFLWGLLATSSLVLGGVIGIWATPGKRTLGLIMGFGAGVLISAVAYELMYESVHLGKASGAPALGFFAGALTFFFADRLIGKIGAGHRKSINPSSQSTLVIPMVLAIILDGVPESTVIGLGILETGTVSLAMLIAVFISNLPEAIAGTTGMKAGGWSRPKILLLWGLIAVVCGFATAAGFSLFGNASPLVTAFIQAFAAGAILLMLANTMIPEAYEHGGKLAGIFTVLGFAVSVVVVVLERM
jgi:ZIP family zinc transporter